MRIVRTALIIVFILSGTFGQLASGDAESGHALFRKMTSDREVLEISCDYTEEDLLAGLSAYDETDGDLHLRLYRDPFPGLSKTAVCNLTYVWSFDLSDQPASLTRRVQFTYYHSPRFTLSQPLVFAVQEGSYTEAMNRLGAEDMVDGWDWGRWIVQTDRDVNYQTRKLYHDSGSEQQLWRCFHGGASGSCGKSGAAESDRQSVCLCMTYSAARRKWRSGRLCGRGHGCGRLFPGHGYCVCVIQCGSLRPGCYDIHQVQTVTGYLVKLVTVIVEG